MWWFCSVVERVLVVVVCGVMMVVLVVLVLRLVQCSLFVGGRYGLVWYCSFGSLGAGTTRVLWFVVAMMVMLINALVVVALVMVVGMFASYVIVWVR